MIMNLPHVNIRSSLWKDYLWTVNVIFGSFFRLPQELELTVYLFEAAKVLSYSAIHSLFEDANIKRVTFIFNLRFWLEPQLLCHCEVISGILIKTIANTWIQKGIELFIIRVSMVVYVCREKFKKTLFVFNKLLVVIC